MLPCYMLMPYGANKNLCFGGPLPIQPNGPRLLFACFRTEQAFVGSFTNY